MSAQQVTQGYYHKSINQEDVLSKKTIEMHVDSSAM